MPVACDLTRWWDSYMSEDEEKEITFIASMVLVHLSSINRK